MKALHKFVSPIFSISAAIFVPSLIIAHFTGGGIGPCGITNGWGFLSIFGVLIGAIGIVVGLPISAIKTYRHFCHPQARNQTNENKHEDIAV
jgi:hypothetical protein